MLACASKEIFCSHDKVHLLCLENCRNAFQVQKSLDEAHVSSQLNAVASHLCVSSPTFSLKEEGDICSHRLLPEQLLDPSAASSNTVSGMVRFIPPWFMD